MYCLQARARGAIGIGAVALALAAAPAAAADQMYFPAVDNVTNVLIQYINQETVRLDISAWYLTEHAVSIAIANRFQAGVPVRLIGDRAAIFEIDPNTKTEFYWLASQGVPIRLRFDPTWYPEINHWKAAIFVGQNVVEFGSANYTTFQLAPWSSTNYSDETAMFTTDPALVGAFKTKFDAMWNDTTPEPESKVSGPPYLKNWSDACANEPTGCDFYTQYQNPAPMAVNTARLEPDNPMPADLIWGQGPDFNNRLVTQIANETSAIDFVIYRLAVDNVTQALLSKRAQGVPIRIIIEPSEYLNRKWPEFWLTHANIDKLWAAGIPIEQRVHEGITHMKTLITSSYATNASSNLESNWQRDHNYFVSAAAKPGVYAALKNRYQAMWADSSGFAPFTPQPADAATLASPPTGATDVSTRPTLTWNTAAFATAYDVYVGTSQSNLGKVGSIQALLNDTPPSTYSLTLSSGLNANTTYYWRVVSRTFATDANSSIVATSAVAAFTTGAGDGSDNPPPPAPPGPVANPYPAAGAIGIDQSPVLNWSAATGATEYAVRIGTSSPPPQVAVGLTTTSYRMQRLSAGTTYYWQVVASNGSDATAGPVWSFTVEPQAGGLDFDGDSYPDIVWRNPDGGFGLTVMQAAEIVTTATLGQPYVDPSWRPVAYADFNGDGQLDILWEQSTGALMIWLMNGRRIVATTAPSIPTIDPAWHVVGAADLDGDGNPDVIGESDDGEVAVWLMDRTEVTNVAMLGAAPDPGYRIAGVADMNGDGKPDLIWRRPSGEAGVWLLNGTSYVATVPLGPGMIDPSWHIAAIGDYDGDGQPDVMWQNTDGTLALAYMQGTAFRSVTIVTPPFAIDAAWRAVGPK